jgi:hypothetical protein
MYLRFTRHKGGTPELKVYSLVMISFFYTPFAEHIFQQLVEVARLSINCFYVQVKPLKELTFNSPDITAGMTSRQFQVMMDVLTNLLFARTPRYIIYLVATTSSNQYVTSWTGLEKLRRGDVYMFVPVNCFAHTSP